jgi:hypothetical protein
LILKVNLTYRVEYKLRVFENRAMRKIVGLKRDEVTGDWIRLHNEELRYLYSSPNIVWLIKSRKMRLVSINGRGAYRDLVGKPEGKRPLGRHNHKCQDNTYIKMYLKNWLRKL